MGFRLYGTGSLECGSMVLLGSFYFGGSVLNWKHRDRDNVQGVVLQNLQNSFCSISLSFSPIFQIQLSVSLSLCVSNLLTSTLICVFSFFSKGSDRIGRHQVGKDRKLKVLKVIIVLCDHSWVYVDNFQFKI